MASDLQIQGEVVVNSEQAESAFNRVGDKATQMANEVATSAGKAGQAVDKIGDGADKGAEKFTRAESRISASIKRATNELELLGKSASQKFEFNISDKGLDATKFEPALKKLREIEAQAMQAQRAATGSLDKMGLSAKRTAAALRGVPAQFTDIVTSLQGGQAPLTVFLQQGGQLKDMFGGAGNAARALGGYVLGLVNPFTIAAAAVGALAFAYNQGAKEADAYNKALITTGNAAGTNAAQLKAYAQEISGIVGTQGKAAESLAALASTGKVGAESLRDAAKAAVEYERATGQAVGKTAEQFASLRNEPLAAVLKLNDGMNFLTDSTYKQIKSLEEQGRTAEAANVAQRAFADTLSSRAGEMERNLGSVERGWIKVKDAAKGAWDAILNVGRASTSVDQLADVRRQIAQRENQIANAGFATNEGGAAFGRPSMARTEQLRAELLGLQAQAAQLEGVANQTRIAADEERKRGEAVKATAAFDKAGEKFLSDKTKMERELAAARVQGAEAGKSQAEVEQRLNEIRASYAKKGGSSAAAENKELREQQRVLAELAGVSSTYYADLARGQAERAKGNISEAQYVEYVEALIQKQPFAVALAKEQADATKAQAKASEEAAMAHLKYLDSFNKGADSAERQVATLQAEEQASILASQGYYSLAQAVELVSIARLKEQQIGLLGNEEAYLAVQREIEAREKLVGLIGSREARKASEDAAKDAQRDWERAAADIERSLTDSLLRGFESGKGFAENLRDTLKNMFSTLVLRPVISAALSPISGGIQGLMGGVGGAGGSNPIGMASNAYSLYNTGSQAWTLGSQYLSGSMSGANALGSVYANATGGGLDALLATNGAYGTAGGGAAGGAGMGALAGAGAFAAVAGVVLNALGAFKSERKIGGGLMGTLGSGSISPWEEWREGGTLFSGPSFSTMNPVAELERQRGKLADLRASGGGNTQQAATLQTIIDNLEEQYGGLAEATAAQSKVIQSAFDAMRKSAGDMADVLGLSSDAARNFTTQLGGDKGLNFDGLKPEEQQAKLAEALATANNEIAQQIIGTWETTTSEAARIVSENLGSAGEDASIVYSTLTDTITKTRYVASEYAKDGEKAIDTLTRLANSLGTVNTIWDQLGNTMLDASLAGADAASRIAEAFGGLEAMSATTGSYFQNFYSGGEQREAARRQLEEQFGKLNLQLPDIDASNAREQYRQLAEAQDRNTEEGLKAYVALLQLSSAFAGLTDSASLATETMEQQRQSAYSALEQSISASNRALQSQLDNAQDVANTLGDLFDLLHDNVRELYGEVDSTRSLQATQGNDFITQALAAAQKSGYLPDSEKLAEAISAARGGLDGGAYTSQFAADRDRLVLAGKLSGLEAIAEKQLTDAQRTVKALETQIDQNEQTLDYWRQQIEIASGTYDGILSVEAAVQQLSASRGGTGTTKPGSVNTVGGGSTPASGSAGTPRVGYGADEALSSFDKFTAWYQGLRNNVDPNVLKGGSYQVPDWLRVSGLARDGTDEELFKQYTFYKGNPQYASDFERIMTSGRSSYGTDGSTLYKSDLSKMPAEAAEFFKSNISKLLGYEGAGLDPVLAYQLYQYGPEMFGLNQKKDNYTEWLRNNQWTDGGIVAGNNASKFGSMDYAGYNQAKYDLATGNIIFDGAMYTPDGKLVGSDTPGTLTTNADPFGLLDKPRDRTKYNPFASYDVGTNYVPRDMLAYIHEGEAVVPKAYNPAANLGGGAGSGRLEMLVEQLLAKVANLEAAANETAGNTRPLPQFGRQFDQYSNGGTFSRQEVVA